MASFTILTPCRNANATLSRALASVRDQQVAAQVEHIVIDGGSTDGSLDTLKRTPGIRFISEPDRGLSHALNKGLGMATGEIVGWLNADDVYLPGALARVNEALEREPQTLWAAGRCVIVDADGREIRRAVTRYKNFLLRRWSHPLHLTQNFVSAPAVFVRRGAFDRVGLFDERFAYSMDYDLWLRLGRISPPAIIDEPLARFAMAPGSLSMTGFEKQFSEHALVAREHGDGRRLAVTANAAISRAIVLAYRAMRATRRARRASSARRASGAR